MSYQLGARVANTLYFRVVDGETVALVRGKVLESNILGDGLFAGMVRVMWSDGRSFWVKPRFLAPDPTPEY
jgi:hypothetical protein